MFDDLWPRVLAAIVISAISGVLGFLSRHWIEALLRGKRGDYISEISGTWEGTARQRRGVIGESKATFTLKSWANIVYGVIAYDGTERKLNVVGGFIQDRYLSLHYRNRHNAILQHGSILLELSGDNTTLTGDFQGVGPISGKIVIGSIELKKQQPKPPP